MNQLKQIKDFSNYFISDCGSVYSNKRGNFIKLVPYINKKNKYMYVSLCKKAIVYKKSIHRLVAEAFIPNPKNKFDVNHIDGNKQNNNVENLEWTTRSENMLHNFKKLGHKGSFAGKFGKDNPKAKVIIQLDKDNKIVAEFYGMCEAERNTGISVGNICSCCKGKREYAGGYKWKYK